MNLLNPFPAMTWTELWFGMPLALLSVVVIWVRNWFVGRDLDMPEDDF